MEPNNKMSIFQKTMRKIITFNNLDKFISRLGTNRLVLVGGCFDILPLGHVRFLAASKQYGMVSVALESDATLSKRKGHLRPIHKQVERAEVLASLETVDYVLLLPHFSNDQEYFNLTKTIAPSVIAVTQGDRLMEIKKQQAQLVNGKVIVIPKISTPSTTQLAKLLSLE